MRLRRTIKHENGPRPHSDSKIFVFKVVKSIFYSSASIGTKRQRSFECHIEGRSFRSGCRLLASTSRPLVRTEHVEIAEKSSLDRASETVQDRGLCVLEVGQGQNRLGATAFSSGTWLPLHDRWPPCHRSMIEVAGDDRVRVARHPPRIFGDIKVPHERRRRPSPPGRFV